MLDTRLVGRDQQIPIEDLAGLSGPAKQASAAASFSAPTRQLLGSSQANWLNSQMAASKATWQVLGQQVLMARMEFPVSVLAALNPSDTSTEAQAAGSKAVSDYLTPKATPAALRTPMQLALMDPKTNPKLGYNLDAWDGYIVARETLLGAVKLCAGMARSKEELNDWYREANNKIALDYLKNNNEALYNEALEYLKKRKSEL